MLPCLPPDRLTHNSRCYPVFQRESGYHLALSCPDSRSIDDRISQL